MDMYFMEDFARIQSLVGPITKKQLRYIEYAVCESFGVFVPSLGPCEYSITPDHSHPGYMIIINLHSACKINIEGESISCNPNRLYVFSPSVIHHEIIEEGFNRYYACMISPELFESSLRFFSESVPVYRGESFPIPDSLVTYIQDFINEYEYYSDSADNQMEILAERITRLVIRKIFYKKTLKKELSYGTAIDRAIYMMQTRFGEELSLEEIASAAHSSPSHFVRLFKRTTDHTPMEFLKKIRLEKARKLLIHSSDSITDIAFYCGFNSSSYFSTAFFSEYNINPGEFRKKHSTYKREQLS